MKEYPTVVDPDVCQVSIDLLRDRVSAFLTREMKSTRIWFADHIVPFPTDTTDQETVDVVLFGGFLRRFLESGNWTAKSLRFWVLSTRVKKVMVTQLGFPEESVGVISREAIYPVPARTEPLPNPDEPFTLVFAGRISALKNIEMFLRTASSLQMDHGLPVGVTLVGNFDADYLPDYGRRNDPSFADHIHEVVSELKWTSPPVFLDKMKPTKWLEHPFTRPMIVSFSTYVCEDFGVSIAQGQCQGWPAIVSDWGGHRDIGGTNVIKVPPLLIGHSHEKGEVIGSKARCTANWIVHALRNSLRHGVTGSFDAPPEPRPIVLRLEEVDSLRRGALFKLGPELQLIYRENLAVFAESHLGKMFFDQYRSIFSGTDEGAPTVVLVNDLQTTPQPGARFMPEVLNLYVEKAKANGEKVIFLRMLDLCDASSVWFLMRAGKMIIPFCAASIVPMLQFLINGLEIAAPIHVIAHGEPEGADSKEHERIRALLRSRDRLDVFRPDRGSPGRLNEFAVEFADAQRAD